MTAFVRFSPLFVVVTLALSGALACGPGANIDPDAGSGGPSVPLPVLRDGGTPPPPDAGGPGDDDAGQPGTDAGPGDVDSGPQPDAGQPDAGQPDAGQPDAGQPDGGVPVVLTSAEGGPCYEAAGAVCEEGLVCTPYYVSGAGTCARPCATEGQACAGGGTCTDYGVDDPFLVCATAVADGAGCDPEQLVVCSGDGLCFNDDEQALGGTCRTPCSCQTGTSCSTAACPTSTCVVTDLQQGDGLCGATAQLGQPCDPVGGGVICEGNAVCLIDALGNGTCRARCETPGTTDPACTGTDACFGEAGAGYCLPTTNLGQGELCTDGTQTPVIPLTCGTGLDCIHNASKHDEGFGACLEDCASEGDAACETGGCYNIDSVIPGGGARCLSELPRGARGCDPLEIVCGDDGGVCVTLNDDATICKQRCAFADCPGGACPCASGESCVRFLDDELEGVCGTLVGHGEACDQDADVYCAPAPGEEAAENAFSACVDTCRFICRLPSMAPDDPDLTCPSGMECRTDPTGRLNDTVRVCVDVP